MQLVILTALLVLISEPIHAISETELSDENTLISRSLSDDSSPCSCPDDLDSRGYRCGRRAASIRAGGESPECPPSINDAQINVLIKQSISEYRGPCPCPYSVARDGRSCGGRSAWSRKGGEKPLCYSADITPGMLADSSHEDEGQIKMILINRSKSRYRGPCPCPYSVARDGSSCGERSAWSKPGGESPLCYPSDVTPEMIIKYKAATGVSLEQQNGKLMFPVLEPKTGKYTDDITKGREIIEQNR